jgi:DNA polymerase alpha subunit A
VERLCAPIEGTNVTLLAECLGLDTSKYRVSSNSGSNNYNAETEIQPLESQVPDEIRFKDCAPLGLLCLSCRTPFSFRGLGSPASSSSEDAETQAANVETDGIHCPSSSCGALLPLLALSAQLESQIRAHTAQYYAATLVCDEATCGNRTRQMSVYGHRCLGPRGLAFGCTGKMQLEYSEKMLYNQLLFLSRCFDVEKVKATGQGGVGVGGVGGKQKTEDAERVGVLAEMNRKSFGVLRAVVEAYLDKSGWGWVSMDGLFGFALKALQG